MSLDGNCNVTRGASISVGGGFNVSITGLQATLFTNDLDNALQSVGLDNTVVEEVIRDIID